MLQDLEFERQWESLPEDKRLRFVALQQWKMSQQIVELQARPLQCAEHNKLMEALENNPDKKVSAANVALGSGFAIGVGLIIKGIDMLLKGMGWFK